MPARNEESPLSPIPLMQITTGFWAFKTLAVAHEMDLFTSLAGGGGTTAADLAREHRIDARPAEMLLTGCAALGLLEKQNGSYRNSALAEEFLVKGKTSYFGGWVRMLDERLYSGWGKLGEAVRTNRPTTWDPDRQASLFDGVDPGLLGVFWQAMHSLSTFTARSMGKAVDFTGFKRLMDVGGGSGAYPIELCRQHPHLKATVYDLAHVTEIAARNAEAAGLSDRVETMAGNFFTEPELPGGHDVILLSMILHDWNEEKNLDILRKCSAALPSGGSIIVSELLVNDEKTGPAPAALMSLNMLIETEGRNYTPAEYGAWMKTAGFHDIRTVWFESPGANGVVIGRKP